MKRRRLISNDKRLYLNNTGYIVFNNQKFAEQSIGSMSSVEAKNFVKIFNFDKDSFHNLFVETLGWVLPGLRYMTIYYYTLLITGKIKHLNETLTLITDLPQVKNLSDHKTLRELCINDPIVSSYLFYKPIITRDESVIKKYVYA